jgi:hypothetical protein
MVKRITRRTAKRNKTRGRYQKKTRGRQKRTGRRQKRTGRRQKRTRIRQKLTRRRYQKGGVRFRDIITMENKADFVGLEVEIKLIPEYGTEFGACGPKMTPGEKARKLTDPPHLLSSSLRDLSPQGLQDVHNSGVFTDLAKIYDIKDLINKIGIITDEPATYATGDPAIYGEYITERSVNIHYPNLINPLSPGDSGITLALRIPANLRELALRYRDRRWFDWYLQLSENRAEEGSKLAQGDFFTSRRLREMGESATVRNILNPPLGAAHPRQPSVYVGPGSGCGSVCGMDIPPDILATQRVGIPPEILALIADQVRTSPSEGDAPLVRDPQQEMITVEVDLPQGLPAGGIAIFQAVDQTGDTVHEFVAPRDLEPAKYEFTVPRIPRRNMMTVVIDLPEGARPGQIVGFHYQSDNGEAWHDEVVVQMVPPGGQMRVEVPRVVHGVHEKRDLTEPHVRALRLRFQVSFESLTDVQQAAVRKLGWAEQYWRDVAARGIRMLDRDFQDLTPEEIHACEVLSIDQKAWDGMDTIPPPTPEILRGGPDDMYEVDADSIRKMTLDELKEALGKRGLPQIGEKEDLEGRLVLDLLSVGPVAPPLPRTDLGGWVAEAMGMIMVQLVFSEDQRAGDIVRFQAPDQTGDAWHEIILPTDIPANYEPRTFSVPRVPDEVQDKARGSRLITSGQATVGGELERLGLTPEPEETGGSAGPPPIQQSELESSSSEGFWSAEEDEDRL